MKYRETSGPLVSVVVPTYNRADYLRESLGSVLAQTYGNLEVIVADNGSDDDSEPLVNAFDDPRIRFRRNAVNRGIAPNIAAAMKTARGKYLGCLPDDDRWRPTLVERLVTALEIEPDAGLAFCDEVVIDAAGRVDARVNAARARTHPRRMLRPGMHQPFCRLAIGELVVPGTVGTLLRRDLIDWDEAVPAGNLLDLYLVYLVCRTGAGAVYVPQRLAEFRAHDLTETVRGTRDLAAKARKAESALYCYGRILEDSRLADLHPVCRRRWAEASTSLGVVLLRQGRPNRARLPILRALRVHQERRSLVALSLTLLPAALGRRLSAGPMRGPQRTTDGDLDEPHSTRRSQISRQ